MYVLHIIVITNKLENSFKPVNPTVQINSSISYTLNTASYSILFWTDDKRIYN